ncbi:DNA-binding protein [Yersinia bercovieri]|uniref:DNA-binding protein n=2 Tax=Yersinia TaxID=629 RepID=UPI00119E5B6C|nr:DNA-binding protein [Yersinia bercovieri]
MEKEWFSARELLFHPLLPGTTQAIHKKAKREDWVFRKKIGVQGKGVEYSIHTLPESIRDYIINNSDM